MAKAIVRVNAFVTGQQFENIYNFIYNQMKAGLEVITVPSYCDVYILNGENIDIQVKDKEPEKTYCSTCKYMNTRLLDQPCCDCYHNGLNASGTDKWEDKDNG